MQISGLPASSTFGAADVLAIEINGITYKITGATLAAALQSMGDYVTAQDIVNNLTTTEAGHVLDARQGKALLDAIEALGAADVGAVAADQGAANAGKALVVGNDGNVTTGKAVRPDVAQTLTAAEQAQARGNIGAAADADVDDLKSAYNDLYTEINDDADIPSSVRWYQGSFYPSTGGDNNTPTNRIRSGWVTLTKDIVGLRPISGYKYEIFAWNAAQTYIGAWNGSEWSKIDGKFFTKPFSLANFDKTNKYKFVLARTDDTAITTAESVNLKYVCSRIDAEKTRIDDVYSPGAITPIMGDLAIKTKNVFNSFTINSGSFSFTVGVSNISNYTDYATVSSVSKNTPPVRIRDFDGQLIYNNLRLNLDKVSKPTTCMWLFDKNGYYLRAVTHSEFYHRTNVANYFKADEYYAIFNLFPGVSGYEDYAWIVDNVNIEWLNATPEYHVGAGKEFTTFNGMLTALADDPREKIVYIDPGEYDIFAEYGGAEYMASLADTAAQMNWRDVCKVVPPNTHIIGLGSVTLKWIATAEEMQNSSVATLFSPLNVSGNCIIENIKVIGQNCRYAVHDETSGLAKYDGAIHHYKNCYFECLQSTYNATTPYGSGHNKNMTLIFDDCEFVNYQNNAWATHHQAATAAEKSTITFNHCIFRRSRTGSDFYVQFTTDKTNGLKDEVRFNGCYIAAKIKFYTASSSGVQQGYDVTLVGSSQVEIVYSTNVTTRYEVRQLNAVT